MQSCVLEDVLMKPCWHRAGIRQLPSCGRQSRARTSGSGLGGLRWVIEEGQTRLERRRAAHGARGVLEDGLERAQLRAGEVEREVCVAGGHEGYVYPQRGGEGLFPLLCGC